MITRVLLSKLARESDYWQNSKRLKDISEVEELHVIKNQYIKIGEMGYSV